MYRFKSRIRYSECDTDGNLSLLSLINYFQDSSIFQSESLGVGMDYLNERHLVWVLSSWQIVVDRYPRLYEEVEIGTRPYDIRSFLGYRNFYMLDGKGNFISRANSLWTLLDTQTMRPSSATQEMLERYQLGQKLDMDYAPRKITIPKGGENGEPIVVKKHHLDTNHHVNNGQYVNLAMELVPEEMLKGGVRELRAEYKMQARLDDVLYPYVSAEEDKAVVSFSDEGGRAYAVVEFR